MSKYFTNLWRNTMKNRGSYLGAVLVIAMGLLVFVAMTDVLSNLRHALREYYDTCVFADVFAGVEGIPAEKLEELERIDGIDVAFGRLGKDVRAVIEGENKIITLHLMAYEPNDRLNKFQVTDPQFSDSELLLGYKMFEAYGFTAGDEMRLIIGDGLETFALAGTVQGPEYIYAMPPGGANSPDAEIYDIACINKARLEKLLGRTGVVTELGFTLKSGCQFSDVRQELTDRLSPYGLSSLVERKDQISNYMMDNEFGELSGAGTVLPAIFLAVSVFMLYIVLRKMIDRDRTLIGTMKAFGFKDRELLGGYLVQGVVIGILGAVTGSVLSIPLAQHMHAMYVDYFNLPVRDLTYYWSTRILGAVIAVCVSMLAVYIGVRELLKIHPAEAMRPAAPAADPTVALPRSWERRLSASKKMSIRFMSRNKLRSMLLAFAIAFPFALTAVLLSYQAVAEQMFFDQFTKVETYDMKAALAGHADYHELISSARQIEDIYDVEAIADYAVTLRHENITLLTSLQALQTGSRNYNIVDIYDHRHAPRSDGLVMNSVTARKLGAQPGDAVEVCSAYLGSEPVEIPVVKVIEESFGSGCYINMEAVSRYFNVGDIADTLLFKVAGGRSEDVKKELTATRNIIALTESERVLKSYREMVKSMMSMMNMLALLSVCTGFILIYNITGISLRERKNEFGTLMILGTRSRDILEIVSFEQTLNFALGILAGYPLSLVLKAIMASIINSDVYRVNFTVPFSAYVYSFLICGAIAALSTRIIFKSIRNIEPAEVLKEKE
ncbi:FtsX-like permease family protein [Desulfoscipio sp. XC116]|uniref:ABC transporter permease n=1 Tax=Desulfoscipio sp. XC116 TaxID=3144975 RepID=UPI00325BEF5D